MQGPALILLLLLGLSLVSGGQLLVAQTIRPYQCGFVLESAEAIQEVYGPELQVLDLQPHDVIADIGGSNGYRMAMFSVLVDSLEIYVQDIDSLCLNPIELQKVKDYYTGIKSAPLTGRFRMVLGNEFATNLPTALLDKALVTVAYHHFSEPRKMLLDIAAALKPDGKIYLIENVVRKTGQKRRRLCNDPLFSCEDLQAQFEQAGFEVLGIHRLGRWWTKMFVLRLRAP